MSYKAVQYEAINAPIKVVELQKPSPKAHQVLVRVKNSSVNPLDDKLWRGGNRVVQSHHKFPYVPGFDVSGIIEELGSEVDNTKFKVGDEVNACSSLGFTGPGTYAEYALVEDKDLARKPKAVGFPEAGAIPVIGLTSYQALVTHGGIKDAGSKVLVLGASSATGIIAIQLAKNIYKAYVAATCSAKNKEFVKSLGADKIIDYTCEDWSAVLRGQEFDIVYDCVGEKKSFQRAKEVIKAGGAFVTISLGDGATDEEKKAANYKYIIFVADSTKTDQLEKVNEYLEKGKIKIPIQSTYTLSQVTEAFNESHTGRSVGKIVISVS